jgi:hypothetical protein
MEMLLDSLLKTLADISRKENLVLTEKRTPVVQSIASHFTELFRLISTFSNHPIQKRTSHPK